MQRPSNPKVLPYRHVASIGPKPPEAQWLVQSLWAAKGVGLIGALPKSLKTWLASELAVAVATGREALGRFPVRDPGPVLFYTAEDDLPSMRARFQAIAEARQVILKDTPVYLIDVPTFRLDDDEQLHLLRGTVAEVRPRLLILDPFVRCVSIDENSAQEVSAVLGSLRTLQREFDVSIIVVHHMRKSPSANVGQRLRGSGDFAAWTDSGLYLTQRGPDLVLFVEHRGAPAPAPMRIRLNPEPTPHLVVEPEPATGGSAYNLRDAVLARLGPRPLPTVKLREQLKVRKAKLLEVLREFRANGIVQHTVQGWALAAGQLPLTHDEDH
ncbi:MAG TPA: AAA family ATPase [Anaeromyxobacteraceae bacterium]|nr:AAA family ATPase [Anaeromyxobacteraceae bacterium]